MGMMTIAKSYSSEARALFMELRFFFAQLRDVLAAKNSPVMAPEDNHRGAFGPKGAKHHGGALRIGQGHCGEMRAKRLGHEIQLEAGGYACFQALASSKVTRCFLRYDMLAMCAATAER